MDKKTLIDRVAKILVSSINLKLKADGLTVENVTPLSNEGVWNDPSVLRQRRLGWYTWIEVIGKDGKVYDIGTAYDIRMKLISVHGNASQDFWLKLMKEVADAASLAMHNFIHGGDKEYSELTAEQIKAAVTEQELVY